LDRTPFSSGEVIKGILFLLQATCQQQRAEPRRAACEAVGWKHRLGGLLLGALCFNYFLDYLVECGYLVRHNIPDNTVINSKVAMDQSVTHTSYRSPFQVTVFLLEVIWYLL
jgi:hypothetical protein